MTFLGRRLSRRQLLAGAGTLVAGGAASLSTRATGAVPPTGHEAGHDAQHGGNMAVGEVDLSRFDPSAYLTHFDYGTTSTLPDGRVLREWNWSPSTRTSRWRRGPSSRHGPTTGRSRGPRCAAPKATGCGSTSSTRVRTPTPSISTAF